MVDELRRELRSVRRQLRLQQCCGAALACGVFLAVAFGAAPAGREDASFGRVCTRSLGVIDDDGRRAAQVYAASGAGAVFLRGPEGRDAVHLIAGASQ